MIAYPTNSITGFFSIYPLQQKQMVNCVKRKRFEDNEYLKKYENDGIRQQKRRVNGQLRAKYMKYSENGNFESEFHIFHELICSEKDLKRKKLKQLLQFIEQNVENPHFCDQIGRLCDMRFVAGLLWRYTCTLGGEDRLIYSILEHLERRMFLNFRILSPLIFGPNSRTYYGELIRYGRNLHKYLNPDQVLDYFDRKRLWETLTKLGLYDFHYSTSLASGTNAMQAQQTATEKIDPSCYDPRFVLRLLLQLTAPGIKLNCRPVITSNALSFVFAATSLYASDLRALAYAFLERFRLKLTELTDEHFPQKVLYCHLISTFRNSVTDCNQRTTHGNQLISQFLARVSKLALSPEEPIFSPLMIALTQKAWIRLDSVPEFFKLFFSVSTEHCFRERQWALRLLQNGISDAADYGAVCKIFALESCLALFCSPMADYWSKLLLLRVFNTCLDVPSAARDMLLRLDFPTWLANAIIHRRTTTMESLELAQLFRRIAGQFQSILGELGDQKQKKGKKRPTSKNNVRAELRPSLLKAKMRLSAQKITSHLHLFEVSEDKDRQKWDELVQWFNDLPKIF